MGARRAARGAGHRGHGRARLGDERRAVRARLRRARARSGHDRRRRRRARARQRDRLDAARHGRWARPPAQLRRVRGGERDDEPRAAAGRRRGRVARGVAERAAVLRADDLPAAAVPGRSLSHGPLAARGLGRRCAPRGCQRRDGAAGRAARAGLREPRGAGRDGGRRHPRRRGRDRPDGAAGDAGGGVRARAPPPALARRRAAADQGVHLCGGDGGGGPRLDDPRRRHDLRGGVPGRPARARGAAGDRRRRDPAPRALRHRRRDPAHAGLCGAHGHAGRRLPRLRAARTAGHRRGFRARRRRFDAGDGGALPAGAGTDPGARRPAVLPPPLRRGADARGVRGTAAGAGGPRRGRRRPARRGAETMQPAHVSLWLRGASR